MIHTPILPALRPSSQTLLPLKYTAPPLRVGVLPRPDLQALLADVRLHPVTLLVAPAGYGKTTLLSQWAQELARTNAPVSWLTFDVTERDPASFLAYLIGAFQVAFPAVGADAWRMLNTATNLDRDWPLVAGALCSDLQRKVPTAAFLLLDDVQNVVDSAVISQLLGYLLRAAPPTLHIVMASRRMPTFAPLARLRTEGSLLEITQRDLHLMSEEIEQLLAGQHVTLSEAELELLLARTEGWALSVQLVARALASQSPEQRGPFLAALRGREEQLLDYLASEVLSELSAEMIQFLRLTALASSFDAELLAEALESDDADYLLGRAQALGLPITPVDEYSGKLRFHPLWRELLLRGVQEIVSQDELMELHRRFGHAFQRRGELEAAFEHFAQANAFTQLAEALRDQAWPLLRTPQRDMVRRWLARLPAEIRESDAELQHMWGVSQGVLDMGQATMAIERAVELYRQNGQYSRELRALADLVALLGWQARPQYLLALCARAIRAANYVRDEWSQGAARVCVATMLYSKGRDAATLTVARQALAYPLSPTWQWLLAMIVGSICCQSGRPTEALSMIDEVLHMQQADLDDRMRQNLLRLRAMALYLLGQTPEAIGLSLETHRYLTDYYRGNIVGTSAMQLAFLLLMSNRVDEAMTYLSQARTAFHDTGNLSLLADIQALEVYSQLARGQSVNTNSILSSVVRRLQDSQSGSFDLRLWLLMAVVLGETGNHTQALELLATTIQQMQRHNYRLFLACAHLYRSFLAAQIGDEALHHAELENGWMLMQAKNLHFLPLLPARAIRHVVLQAIRRQIMPEVVGHVLHRQLGEDAVELLHQLLNERDARVRAHAARLLGVLGSAAAYVPLRTLQKDKDAQVRQAADHALSNLVYRPAYTLHIRTLGSFALWRGDEEVRDRDWRSSKARQLFQLLLTERGRTVPRERLLDALWPELDAEAAANNLRVTLNRTSKAIEPDRPEGAPSSYILQQGETFCFNADSDYQLDAATFMAAVAEGQQADRQGQRVRAVGLYRQAVAEYRGPYLPDAFYEDWSVVERERLTMLFNDAALRLGALLLEEGHMHESIGLAWRVLEQDQTHEEAYRLLMRAHASLGERSTALRLYERCVQALQAELGVEPLDETTALYQSIRTMH
jgi:ATP/maltotriose-dependent transcriptional regulator MalT/DNA-binding SARP family transcriptional activator